MEALTESERVSLLDAPDAEYRAAAAGSWVNRDLDDKVQRKLLERARKTTTCRSGRRRGRRSGPLSTMKVFARNCFGHCLTTPRRRKSVAARCWDWRAMRGMSRFERSRLSFTRIPTLRVHAMEAMRNSFDRTFAEYFPKHLNDPDPEIKREAIYGVGYLGITDRADELKRFFDDDDYRSDALFAFALSMRAEISRGRIRALFRKIEDIAGGLAEEEVEIVQLALDERLMLHGHNPVFYGESEDAVAETAQPAPSGKVGRNDPCPCGSGKKFKKCCGA